MIVSGKKTEEYREIKPYWIDKLVNQDADSGFIGYANEDLNINSEDFPFTVVGSDESLLLGATHFGEWVYPNGEKPQPKIFGEIEYIHSLTFSSFMATRRIARASKKRLTASPSVSHKRVCAQTNG